MKRKANRNLNPHKEAYLATLVWGEEQAAAEQEGGCMDFYDTLSEPRKKLLAGWIDQLEGLPRQSEMQAPAPRRKRAQPKKASG
jgi:hypothetical protein